MNSKLVSQKWLQKAIDDLDWTRANLQEKVWYGACFTAQQAIEKALKAFLLLHDVSLPKIHDISALLEECAKIDPEFSSLRETILPLVDYYVQTRYPDVGEFMDFTGQKAEEALSRAEKLIELVKTKLD